MLLNKGSTDTILLEVIPSMDMTVLIAGHPERNPSHRMWWQNRENVP
jgi:hypothetical protein